MTIFTTQMADVLGSGLDTIGTCFTGAASLSEATVPGIDRGAFRTCFPLLPSWTIWEAIKSLLSAHIADGIIGDRHHSTPRLIALGVANIVAPLFGGIPVTGPGLWPISITEGSYP